MANGKGNNRRGQSSRRPRGRVAPQQPTVNPPTIVSAPPQRIKLRFKTAANSNIAITRASLLSLLVSFNENIATSVVPQITGVKLEKLDVWIGGGTPGTVDVTWLGDLGQDVRLLRSWMAGLPARLATRPPRGSRAGMWSRSDSLAATLGELLAVVNIDGNEAGTNTVLIDVVLSVTRADVQLFSSAAVGGNAYITVAGATNGPATTGLYVAALDCIAPGVLTKGLWNALPVGVQPYSTAIPTTFTRVES